MSKNCIGDRPYSLASAVLTCDLAVGVVGLNLFPRAYQKMTSAFNFLIWSSRVGDMDAYCGIESFKFFLGFSQFFRKLLQKMDSRHSLARYLLYQMA